jgi:sarcosine oxidase, subunit gamma
MADAVTIANLPPATRFIVRGDGAAIAALEVAFGVDFPREACRAATKGERAALWLGPDEWLLLAPDGDAEVLTQTLTAALRGEPASIVEISDRQIAIGVSGRKAAETLNAFNALDLHTDAFPVGMCTRTLLGKAEIVLWRTAPDAFHIDVWRSFAPYVLGCLDEAVREYV